MADRINTGVSNNYLTSFYEQPQTFDETQTAVIKTQKSEPKPRKLPPVENTVSLTALGCNTESKLARAGYMAAAAKAGIADVSAQSRFADQMLARNPQLVLNSTTDLDDAKVKSRLLNREIDFTIDDKEKAALEQFREKYVKNNGVIRFNRTPTIDLRQAQTADGVNNTAVSPANNKFSVLLDNRGATRDKTRILAQYAENTYKGGNLWGANYRQIAELSAGQGVNPKITKTTPVGNKVLVEFEITPLDRAKIHENYKIVQAQVNEIEKIVKKINDENPVSQFILGAVNGVKDSVVGTAEMLAHPLETLNAIKEVTVALSNLSNEDVAKIAEQLKDKIKHTVTTKDGINSLPYGAGYAVGAIAAEVLLGKGAGAALRGIKGIAAVDNLLAKLDDFKALTKVKVAEAFSDEAAAVAKQSLLQNGKPLVLLPGAIPPELFVIAGNKIKNGAVNLVDFSAQMVKEVGEQVRPYVDKLYRDSLISLDLSKGKQIISSSGKAIDQAIVKEAKEKVYDLVKNNKPVELEEFFEGKNGIRNRYGAEFANELKRSRDEFVDKLYEANRRTVNTHDLLGGHIREQHIGRSETWLRNRLNQPENALLRESSSFRNDVVANKILGKFAKQFDEEIEAFLKNPNKKILEVRFETGELSLGTGVTRGKSGAWDSTRAYVMIVKDNSERGWHVVTAYPTLGKEVLK